MSAQTRVSAITQLAWEAGAEVMAAVKRVVEVEAVRCVHVATVNWSRYYPLARSPSSIS